MSYLPSYYTEVLDFQLLQDSIGKELQLLIEDLENIMDQLYIDTTTWGLDRWEKEFGLTTDPSQLTATRREIIKAKMQGSGTTTSAMIQRIASTFSGGDVIVEQSMEAYHFLIRFVGQLGIPPNMAGLIQTIEEIKPAHLSYDFVYTYTWWESLQSLTWSQARVKTWNDLKVFEGA